MRGVKHLPSDKLCERRAALSLDTLLGKGPKSQTSITGDGSFLAGPSAVRLLDQLTQVGNTFDEDCLTLNIWTKPQTGERAKAVLFWIYGGGKYLDD
ncbi:hypothetical protein LTS18_011964 [Coniosporium uncinatum]|uniref:Uncharacterized protein n=1 Tax=Coniosporium uncinatum TaxID=93489 RepID=A0ACC3DWG2_9PEZI|nr:hypothetical protein LTS18_011964 [Coniosporium uncinatum]